ncbi:MAG: leucine-rich repeat domain-containing protein [Clostridiales bacterium]|nr:leucine-rich repeat domain-containing protein [Clostridiales bacterium]
MQKRRLIVLLVFFGIGFVLAMACADSVPCAVTTPLPTVSMQPIQSAETETPKPTPEVEITPVPMLCVNIENDEELTAWLESDESKYPGAIQLVLGANVLDWESIDIRLFPNLELWLPEGLTEFGGLGNTIDYLAVGLPSTVKSIEQGAFFDCSAVLLHPDNKWFVKKDGVLYDAEMRTVYHCDVDVEQVTLPDSVREIGYSAFRGCSELREIILSPNLEYVRDLAFEFCSSLEELNFPVSLKRVGYCAFIDGLFTTVRFSGDTVDFVIGNWEAIAPFDGSEIRTIIFDQNTQRDWYFGDLPKLQQVVFLCEPPKYAPVDVIFQIAFRTDPEQITVYYLSEFAAFWAPNGETTWRGVSLVAIDSLDELPPLEP